MLPGTSQIAPFLKNCHIFARMGDADVAFIAEEMEALRFKGDEMIFEQGADATDFYFVYNGRVKVTRLPRPDAEEELVGFLNDGDYLGLEVLQNFGTHNVSAQAVSDCIVLRLPGEHFNRVVERSPELVPRLKLILGSYNFSLKSKLPWVNPEEYIYYIARKHPFILVLNLVPLVLGLLVLAGILLVLALVTTMSLFNYMQGLLWLVGLVWGILLYVDWSNDYYVVTNRRVVFQERIILFYDSRQESPLEQVQSSVTRTGWWGRRIGFGDVAIRTYIGEIMFRAVQNQQDVSDIVEEHRRRAMSMMRQAELRTMDETIARKLGVIESQEPAPPKAVDTPRPQTRLQRFLNTVFRLRYQDGDKITYRTHWFILLKRIWFQTLSFLLVSGAALFMTVRGPSMPNLPVVGILLALLLLWMILLLWWIYIYYDWHHDEYIVTNEQVSDINKKPLGKEEKRTAPIKNILSIEYRRLGILGLILNYGTVFIRVGTETFTFDDVFDPAEVQRELFQRLAKLQLREKQAQAEGERQRMADWLAAYHRVTHR